LVFFVFVFEGKRTWKRMKPLMEKRKQNKRGKLSLPVQVVPVPMYPELQAQLKVPGPVEEHVALGEQLLVPKVQLLMAGEKEKRASGVERKPKNANK